MPQNARLLSLLPAAALAAACPGPNPVLADGSGDYSRGNDALTCLPNNDGVIEATEVNLRAGLAATYRVNPPGTLAPVDVAGRPIDGQLEWDMSSLAGEVVSVPLEAVSGAWFAELFPSADFAVGSDVSGDTLQVFRLEEDRLLLLGLVSRQPDITRLIYDTPIVALRFPLRLDDSWTAKSTVTNGRLGGLPVATEDTYEVKVDALGAVRLPYVKLDHSLKIQLHVTSHALGGATAAYYQHQWFHECYGEVARAVSQRDEASPTFSEAAELRRLSF